jgi:hypothetical protein
LAFLRSAMEPNGRVLPDIRFREYGGDFCSRIGHFARQMRLRMAAAALTTSAGLTLTGRLMN